MDFIETYYSPRQVSCPDSASPSPRKPAWVVADWIAQGFPIGIFEPTPASREQISLAHSPEYVDGILNCELLNGFYGRQQDVADSLPWTCGSLLSASRGALNNGLVTCSPTSGFHHARYEAGSGFCTFNGLMVAALALKAEGKVRRVGILDCDHHYGDGTAEIMDELAIGWIQHITQGFGYSNISKQFISELPNVVRSFTGCDLLIYQAGADPHICDPLGGFLTTEELAERDQIVFAVARTIGVPVVWNLAGGYQEPVDRVLEIHRNTMAACIAEYLV